MRLISFLTTNNISCLLLFSLFSTFFIFSPLALSGDLPSGPQVQIGSPTITSDGKDMTINANQSDKTWIDWKGGFNIGVNNSVNNIGPSPAAAILHNDVSGAISNIQGVLKGNCNVFLLNPNGILFSPTARVNVGGLVASSLMISREDFLSGNYVFKASDIQSFGSVINAGNINALNGEGVTLLGGSVQNLGVINANLGRVNLVSGSEVTLNLSGDGTIQAAVDKEVLNNVYDQDGNKVNIGVNNVGEINAQGGKVYIETEAVQGVFDKLVNQEGIVRANSLVNKNGKIVLISNSPGIVENTGTLDTSAKEIGANGGSIEMHGSKVGQFGEVHADALEGNGGNITLYAQDVVALSSGSVTTANAGVAGNGGNITVYSPDTALFWPNAQIEAKGGANSGDGGFVEISGKEQVLISGLVNAGGPKGEAGVFLIDPTDITVVNPTVNTALTDDGDGTFTCNANANDVLDTTLEGYLNNGTNVVLDTSDYDVSGPYAGTGNITVSTAIDSLTLNNGDVGLTLYAANDIVVNAAIDATGATNKLNVALHANQVVANATDDGDVNAGDVDINAAITTNGGTFTSTGVAFDNTGGAITTSGGAVTLNHTGAVTVGAAIDTSGAAGGTIDITGSSINLAIANALTTNTANITLNSPVTLGADTTLNTGSGAGNVTFASTIDGGYGLTVTAGTGTITFGSAIGGTTPVNSLSASAGTINLNGSGVTTADVSGNDVILTGAVVLGTDVSIDTDQTTNDGNVTFSSTINGAQALTVTAGTGDITIGGTTGGTTGLTSLSLTGNNISIADIGTTSTEGVTGDTTATASNQLTFTGTTYKANTQSYTAAAGNNFLVNAGAPTTFSSSNDTITFTTGTILLANGSDLFMNTDSGLGNIALGAISGTNSEDVTLDAGTGNVYVGTIGAGAHINTVTIDGAEIHLYNDITTSDSSGNDVTLTGAVKLENSLTIDTDNTNADGNITFSGTASTISGVTSARTLTLQAGSGNVTLGGAIGAGNLISTLTVASTGTTKIGANITTLNANADFSSATNVVLGADVVIDTGAGAGNVLFSNSGANSLSGGFGLRIDAGTGNVTFDNATQLTSLAVNDGASGSGATAVTFNGAVDIPGSVDVIAGGDITVAAAGSIAAGSITLDTKTNDLGNDIVINGDVSTTGDNTITLTSGDDVNIAQAAAASITGVNGEIDITTDDTVLLGDAANTYGGAIVTTGTGAVDINNTGALTMNTASGTKITGGGGVDISGASTIAGEVSATSGVVDLHGAVTLAAATTVASTNSNVIFDSTIDGAQNLTVNADSGTVTFSGAVGSTTSLTGLIVSAGTISAGAITTTGAADTAGGNVSLTSKIGNITAGTIAANGGVASADSPGRDAGAITLNSANDITVTTLSAIGSAGNDVTFDAAGQAGGAGGAITLTANNDISLTSITTAGGAASSAVAGDNAAGGAAGAIAITAAGDTTLSGNLTSTGGNGAGTGNGGAGATMTLNTNLVFAEASALTFDSQNGTGGTPGADGNVILNGNLNGTAGGSLETWTVNAGAGTVTLNGNIGNIVAMGDIDVNTTGTLNLGGNVTVTGAASVLFDGATTTTLTKDVMINGAATSDAEVIKFATLNGSNALTIAGGNADITLAGTTQLTGLTITGCDTIDFTGAVSIPGSISVTADETAADTIDVQNTIDSTGGSVTFSGPVELNAALSAGQNVTINGATTLATGAITITADNGDITLNGDTSGAFNLTLAAANGNVEVNTVGSGADPTLLDINSATATLDGATIVVAGNILLDGTGLTTLNTDVSMDATGTSVNLGNLTGTHALTISASNANGDVTLNDANITALTINDANDVSFNGDFKTTGAASVTGSDGTITVASGKSIQAGGLVTLTTSGAGGIDINGVVTGNGGVAMTASGGDIAIDADVTTSGDSTITLTSSNNNVNIAQAAAAAVTSVNGKIDIDAGTSVLLGSSTPYAGQLVTTGTGNIDIDAPTAFTMAGTGTQVNSGGTVNIGTNTKFATVTTAGSGITAVGNIAVDTTGQIDINAPVNSTQAGNIVMTTDTGNILLSDEVRTTTTGDVTLTATSGYIDDDDAANETEYVAGDTITLTAATGIGITTSDIDTQASTIDASTTGGSASINIVNNTSNNVTIVNSGTAGTTSNFTFTQNGGGAVIVTSLTTTDGNVTIDVNSPSSTPGLTATSINAGGTTAGYGDVTLTTDNAGMVLTSVLSDDDISVTASAGDITIGQVGDSGTDDISITATTGSIDEIAPGDSGADIIGDAVTLTAEDGIGGSLGLETTIASLDASVTSVGDIDISETDGITLTDVDTADGDITVSAGGQIVATDVDAGGNDGDVTLSTTTGGMILTSVLANDDITATADAGDITLDVVGDAGTDDVTITATAGSINEVAAEDAGADITADAVVLTAQDEIGGTTAFETEVRTISADSTSAGDIVFTELDNDNDGINLLSIDTNNGNITITTNGGTHEAGTETTITSVKSDTGVAGTHNISITASTGDITLAGNTSNVPNVQSDDDIILTATAGSITEDSTLAVPGDSYVDIVGDKLTITAQDEIGSSSGEYDIETTIADLDASSTSQGDIVITETDGITLSDVDTANGAITIVAGGQITATDVASLTDSDSNDISLTSTGSGIEAQLINAGTTAGDVTLDAQGGAITQDGDAGADVIADVLTASAAGGIDLDTTVNSISATASAAGTITLDETNAVTLTDLNTTDGSITVTSGGNMTVTSVTAGGDTGSNDDVSLTTTSGDIIMSGDTTALNDEVTLTSAGDITDTTDGTTDISATNLTITANSGAVGATGTNNELDTDVDTLTLAAQGPVYILEKDAITLTSVVTTNGLIDIEAGGTITTSTVTAEGSHGINLYATGGDIFDTGGGLITAGGQSSFKASGIIGTTSNPVDVNINGDLWVWAGSKQDEVSVILKGTVQSSGATERVEIYEPSPPGLVILNNHLMGGGNYGSGSVHGSILSRGHGDVVVAKSVLGDLYYMKVLQPWGYKMSYPWVLSQALFLGNEFLNGPKMIIDGSKLGISVLPSSLLINPAVFQPKNYYIIRQIKK